MKNTRRYGKQLRIRSMEMRELAHQLHNSPTVSIVKQADSEGGTVVFTRKAVDLVADSIEKYVDLVKIAIAMIDHICKNADIEGDSK